jgi:hypothetical protein
MTASPAAFAARQVNPRASAKAPTSGKAAHPDGVVSRPKRFANFFLRRNAAKPTDQHASPPAKPNQATRDVRSTQADSAPRAKPSIVGDIAWGAAWATVGTAAVVFGAFPIVPVLAGAGVLYHAVHALLLRRDTSLETASSIASNSSWGAFWTTAGLATLANGQVLIGAIELVAGAYNVVKAHSSYKQLSSAAK